MKEVTDWYSQSPWLFLLWNNVKLKRPGSNWSDFIEQMYGKKLTIGIWRKIVETHFAKTNTIEQQERLSTALLHQHHTGRLYYVSEDANEVAEATTKIWNQVLSTPSTSSNPSSISKSSTQQISVIQTPITKFQQIQTPIASTPQQITTLTITNNSSPTFTSSQPNYQYHQGDWKCSKC
jgi:hypothetical protein